MGKLIFFVLFLGFTLSDFAQNNSSFKTIDSLSYALYINKSWDSLARYGEKTIREGSVDYYYLRMRTGIAYYEKQYYGKAIKHFEKALTFNQDDPVAQEYLYYCFINTGRDYDAKVLTAGFSTNLMSKIHLSKKQIFDAFYYDAGVIVGNNIQKNKNLDLLGPDSVFGSQTLTDNIFFSTFSLSHQINKRLSVFHSYNFTSVKNNFFAAAPNFNLDNKFLLSQNEYYINASYTVKEGMVISPAFHYLHGVYSFPGTFVDPVYGFYRIYLVDSLYNNYLASLSVAKDISCFNLNFFVTHSNIKSKAQTQIGFIPTFYPFYNLNYYLKTTLVFQQQIKEAPLPPPPSLGQPPPQLLPDITVNHLILEGLAGMKLLPKMWIEAYLTLGSIENYNEKNSFLVYNFSDVIKFRCGANLFLPINDKIDITLRYQFMKTEYQYVNYFYDDQVYKYLKKTNTNNYINNLISGGIKWKL